MDKIHNAQENDSAQENDEPQIVEEEGAHHHEEGGAQHDEEGGAHRHDVEVAPIYNLRDRHVRNDWFRDAMDNPHGRQTYDPPVQLLQQGLEAQCKFIFGWFMTQMSAKAGIDLYGEQAEEALLQEFIQQRDLDVYTILDPLELTPDHKRAALRAINLIKLKRSGDLKGRTVADGSKQRDLYPKSETASPAVHTLALMLTIIIDAYERRDVATADVAGAYLKAYMDDYVLIKFTGQSVDILLKMEPAYEKFVTMTRGAKTLYGKLNKALYGCVKSALLWYRLFHETLKQMGFTINPYDPCVANCNIEGAQCTIAWYVDDMKISHVNPEVVTRVIDSLEEKFGKMSVTRGREHNFLGMNIVYTDEQTAKLTMKQYLRESSTRLLLQPERIFLT